jgi:hypothetical protein
MKRAKSSREIRRQKERQDRKLLMEMELAPADRLKAAFYRNGITLDDMKKEYERGFKDGRKISEDFAFHAVYAAFLITMIDHHGMEQDEAISLLREMDNQVVLCIEDRELMDEAYERTGVEINWTDSLERIQTKE